MEFLKHKDVCLPLIGFGSWQIGDDPSQEAKEVEAIQTAIKEYDMCLLDTAEMYGEGKSELVIGKAIKSLERTSLFIVGKILPQNAILGKYEECCRNSLKRLGINFFDLYLLHWKSHVPLQEMVDAMEHLKSLGLIKHWGVSNFDTNEMEELFKCKNGNKCFTNQVLYNIRSRGIEYDLIPWCVKNNVLVMAYSPLCNNSFLRNEVCEKKDIIRIAQEEDKTLNSLMLSFVIQNRKIITIFKTANIEHLQDNMKNVFDKISNKHLEEINEIYPFPTSKIPLEKI
ncbi:MAG: aldo/keto reductase [Anaeroplasmataceae bacterium]|nr:aldo/keto reductase [Anaeroplasmataceae bacterium]MDE6414562.1 aldo/keto reductase [Anaeroplasmataceae bacterium]